MASSELESPLVVRGRHRTNLLFLVATSREVTLRGAKGRAVLRGSSVLGGGDEDDPPVRSWSKHRQFEEHRRVISGNRARSPPSSAGARRTYVRSNSDPSRRPGAASTGRARLIRASA